MSSHYQNTAHVGTSNVLENTAHLGMSSVRYEQKTART